MKTDDLMPVQEFEMIYATAIELVKTSSNLFDLALDMKTIPKDLYAEVVRVHNASCDFIEAYRSYSKED